MNKKIIIVDDDTSFLSVLERMLTEEGFDVKSESNPVEVMDNISELQYDALLLDVKMPGVNGLELLEALRRHNSISPIIMVSGQSTIQTAVDAIKLGAYDFVEKPVDPERLLLTLNNALQNSELRSRNVLLNSEVSKNHRMVGNSRFLENLIEQIKIVAPTNAKILIQGESGTGKELVAWAIHEFSDRCNKPFIKLNCAAIPENLLESELFGHKKGSFTGADRDKQGKFIVANRGTLLFLDEIGDMSLNLQAKLLRAIEENEVEIIGEAHPREVDVRIVSATNKDLSQMVDEGSFREDLYHRLNVINLHIEPLRNRKDDIVPLTKHFINQFSESYNKLITEISSEAEQQLLSFDYKGNIRELRNIIEKVVIFSTSKCIDGNTIALAMGNSISSIKVSTDANLRVARKNFEKSHIIDQLNKNNWVIGETANALGMERTNLFRKMKDLNIEKENKS